MKKSVAVISAGIATWLHPLFEFLSATLVAEAQEGFGVAPLGGAEVYVASSGCLRRFDVQ